MALGFGTGGSEQSLTIVIKARNEALAQLQKTSQSIKQFGADNERALKDVRNFSGLATAAVAGLGLMAIKAAGDMEQTRIAFNTMLGSAEKGGAFLKELYDFAKRTPFTITNIEAAGKQLLAYNIAQQDVLPTLKTLGDLAAGVGTDKFPQLVLAYGQVRAAGKLYGTELRQFTETGIPLIDALAQHFGVATSEIRGMVEDGKVGFKDVQQALEGLTEEGGKFADLMDKQSKSLNGMWSNLQDSFTLLLRSIGTQFLPMAKSIVGGLTSIITRFQEWSEANPRLSSTLLVATGVMTAMVSAVTVGILILPRLTAAIKLVGLAMKMALGPWGLVIAGVIMLGGLFAQLADQVGGFGRAWNIVILNIERVWWIAVKGVLDGINMIVQYIPYLNTAMASAIDGVSAKIDTATERYNALIDEGVQVAIDKTTELGGVSLDNVIDDTTKLTDEMVKAAEAVAETEKKITDLQKAYLGDLIDAKKDYATAYVEQEQKVRDLKQQIRDEERKKDDDQDRKRLDDLRDQYDKEKLALQEASTIKTQLSDEVAEARRRASLTDFEREVEDISARTVLRNAEYTEKLTAMQKELEAQKQKAAGIQQSERQTTVVVSEEVNKREKDTISSVNRQISAYENLAEAASGGKKSFNFGFSTANSTPAYRGFATGGVVDGPLGSPRMILAHGGERVIPNGGSQQNGGATYVMNINNPVIGKHDDLREFRKQMEKAWRDVTRVHNLTSI